MPELAEEYCVGVGTIWRHFNPSLKRRRKRDSLLSHRNPALGCSLGRRPRRRDAELSLSEDGYQSPVNLDRLEMPASLLLCDVGRRRVVHQAHKQTDCYDSAGTLGDAQNACGVIRLNLALVDRHAPPSAAAYTQAGIAGHPRPAGAMAEKATAHPLQPGLPEIPRVCNSDNEARAICIESRVHQEHS